MDGSNTVEPKDFTFGADGYIETTFQLAPTGAPELLMTYKYNPASNTYRMYNGYLDRYLTEQETVDGFFPCPGQWFPAPNGVYSTDFATNWLPYPMDHLEPSAKRLKTGHEMVGDNQGAAGDNQGAASANTNTFDFDEEEAGLFGDRDGDQIQQPWSGAGAMPSTENTSPHINEAHGVENEAQVIEELKKRTRAGRQEDRGRKQQTAALQKIVAAAEEHVKETNKTFKAANNRWDPKLFDGVMGFCTEVRTEWLEPVENPA